jgi:hypothetical protein
MSETKHTPGPWTFQYADESGECFIIAGNLGGMVGAALPWPTEIDAMDFRRVIANARLMSASPDLLAMLKVAQLWLDVDGRFDMQGINAAISKAEGSNTTLDEQERSTHG